MTYPLDSFLLRRQQRYSFTAAAAAQTENSIGPLCPRQHSRDWFREISLVCLLPQVCKLQAAQQHNLHYCYCKMSPKSRTYRVTTVAIFASAAAFSLSTQKNRMSERKRIRDSSRQDGYSYYMKNNNKLGGSQTSSSLNPLHESPTGHGLDHQETACSWDSSTHVLNPEFTDHPSTPVHTSEHHRSSSSSSSLFMGTSTSEDQRQFEMHVGKAVDTLRHDYPNILVANPDFSIYDPHITVVDPSGVKLHNLHNYRTSLSFLHAIINFFYCTDKSGLTFRVHYDGARRNIRVSWNAILIPRIIYGGIRNRLHVDGISVYEIDYMSGLITQHRIEQLLINDAPVQAPQGIFLAIAREAMQGPEGIGIPVLSSEQYREPMQGRFVMEFQQGTTSHILMTNSSSLFSASSETGASNSQDHDVLQSMTMDHPLFNVDGFEKKNASRKKFGLPPITPSEYIDIQAKVQELDSEQRAKASAVASSNAATDVKQKQKGNLLEKIFGKSFESTCESNFDCERPEICCDFGFIKKCCRSGLPILDGSSAQLQPRLIPVPASSGFPRGGPDGMDDDYY